MKYRSTATALTALALAATLSACSSDDDDSAKKSTPSTPTAAASASASNTADTQRSSGIPPKPTGPERAALLAAIKAVAPDAAAHEEKAIDAARNQCQAINSGGAKLDWSASQRFSYKDVTTTEAQGKAINQALKASGFCNT
ncbi:hypothetical protein ACWEV4_02465 [Streptomyces sp. NPDC003860]